MSKKILLIAGALLAAGTVAAVSAPHFRGGHHRHGAIFGDPGDGPQRAHLGERLKEMDANKDGAVTLEEFLARRNPGFARLDKNNDGSIDAAEFEAAARESGDYWTKRFMKRFDADKDGKITKDEFARARKERFAMWDLNGDGRLGLEDLPPGMRERIGRWKGDRAEGRDGKDDSEARKGGGPFTMDRLLGRVGRQFSRLDKNGDGFIDAGDLATLAAERVTFASQRFLRRFDADRDGKVTIEEFNRLAKERFAHLDLDDDGKITEADLPPMMRGRGFLR